MTTTSKPPAASAVEQNVYKVFPNDLNSRYTVFGGLVMSLCDRTALIVAERHSGKTCVPAETPRSDVEIRRYGAAGQRRAIRLAARDR